ncbi:uncharacterized protein LOC122624252 isoform X2 [Drosophila teissieri]|uniref:uncharacterized protein LOC122624252 isoform X2 n=1 Tax=Drosophila teissieri TaxID=7243 RepID=UPI001CBA0463|nr:uncharacterized protein LOC122624252 isoform X2 [Drosophila teissieri]
MVPPTEGRKHQVTGDLRSHCRWRIGDVWPNLLQSQGARNLQHLSWTSVAGTPPVVNIEVPMWIPRSRHCGHFRVAGTTGSWCTVWRWSLPEFGQGTHRFKWIRYALRLPISCQPVLWFFLQLSGGSRTLSVPAPPSRFRVQNAISSRAAVSLQGPKSFCISASVLQESAGRS